MEKGYLNAAITMNYTNSNQTFRDRSQMLIDRRPNRGYIVPGMSLGNDANTVMDQVALTRTMKTDGFACFAYPSLFDLDKEHAPKPLALELKKGPLAEPAALPWAKKEKAQ
jgi:hypothetical protein